MTFPTIPTVAASRVLVANQADASATRTFPSLSSLTKNSGDLLIAIIVAYQSSTTNAQFSSWGGSFTEFHDSGTSTTLAIGCAYKWSDGTETGTFTVTQAATITGHASMILLSIPGGDGTTAPEAGSRADGTSAAADPAAFDPGGWAAEDTLWIAVGGSGMTNAAGTWTAIGGAPTNYTSYVDTATVDSSTVGQTEAAVAFRQLNAASEDVATFASTDVSNARNSALVIAVRPANVVTATPATIDVPVTPQAPTVSGGGTTEPAAIAVAVTFFTASIDVEVHPDLIWVTATALDPVASSGGAGDATATPAVIDVVATPQAVTTSAGATATPAVIDVTATPQAPTVTGAGTATPAAFDVTVALDAVTLSAGSTVSPATIDVTATPQNPTTGGDATATPAVIDITATPQDPTLSAGATASPAVTSITVTLDAVTTSAGATVTGTQIDVVITPQAPTATGSSDATATPAVFTVAVTFNTPKVSVRGHPVAVSGNSRYLVDQIGNPWFGVGDSPWCLATNLSTSDITVYLEDRASKNVNLILFEAPEHFFSDNAPNNINNDPAFTGTAFQSSLNDAYWDVVEHAVAEALRLGITCMICPAYLGFAGSEEGWDTEIAAATNAQMTTYGQDLAARFGAYPNIVWLIGHDQAGDATEEARQAALSDALQANTTHLVTVGQAPNGLGSDTWEGSGVDYDFDTAYYNNEEPANGVATGWAATPTMPTGFVEGIYEGEQAYSNQYNDEPFIRSQMYGPLCAGATYILFGNNPIWHFQGINVLYPFSNIGTWQAALDSPGSIKLEVFAGLVADLGNNWATMTPDTTDTFLTVGEGTGTTRAAARFDATTTTGIIAICYRPHSGAATLTFDLTELDQVANVRVSKFDPFDGTYTTINTYSTTGSQSIGSLGTNGAGDGDWLLVFEVTGGATATPSTIDVTATPQAPALSAGATVSPSEFAVTVTLDAVTTSAGATAAPALIDVTAFAQNPAASGGGSATATPATIDVTASPQAPTLSAGWTVTTAVLDVTAFAENPTATGGSDATATPATFTVTTTLDTPTLSLGAGPTPTTIDVTALPEAPGVSAGWEAAVATIAVTVTFLAPIVTNGTGVPTLQRRWIVHAEDRRIIVDSNRRYVVPPETRRTGGLL